ncbi:MBL fold metallo-hydrolase [Paractinoplanes durhamensis]|uniref:MBL fold metallo-hydrolase n=1 Tax=Paractinoplanes durhamensis TaxID=113563 RepID=UPI00362FE301
MSTTSVTWWGHSTVWLADSGTTLLTDPVLTGRVAHLRRMAGPTPRLPAPPDAVLLSHLHADHFHLASLRIVPGSPRLIVPRGAAAFVARNLGPGFARRCVELAPGEETTVGAVKVRAVPAAHDGGRGPWSRERALAVGFVVEGAARTWFAGDTGLFDEMNDIGPLDLALIPVGGWGPTLGSHGHLDAADAVEAVRRAKAARAVPVHYGTFWPIAMGRVRSHMFHQPGTRFAELAAEATPTCTCGSWARARR